MKNQYKLKKKKKEEIEKLNINNSGLNLENI